MKNIFKSILFAAAVFCTASCGDFLDRPSEDNYNTAIFYKNDAQVEQGVNYLYNSPWFDFQRGFIKVGEVMSGNMYWKDKPYMNFSTNGTDEDLQNMSYSLWSVNAHANTVIKNILASSGPSQAAKDKAIGECLTLKALAYFFLVRSFGDVPIVHDNSSMLAEGNYNDLYKVRKEDVYEYIILTLEKAMELLPKNNYIGKANRIDYYAAEALLAKVYLTKAGLGRTSQDPEMLKKAADYAEDVILNSGRSLTPSYEDVFRLAPKTYNQSGECLITWHWVVSSQWTSQNYIQCDIMFEGFDEHGDLWGGWQGPSVDLQEAFGVKATDNPSLRAGEKDIRRKATLMLAGDQYPYFWRNKVDPRTGFAGFDYVSAMFDIEDKVDDDGVKIEAYGKGCNGFECPTGSNWAKNLYGNSEDHKAELGYPSDRMASSLPTHVLRLSDIYLVYAEALVATDNAKALEYVNKVRERAGADKLTSVTLQDIWKERRLELAGEGDYWYDFVRRSYFEIDNVIAELKAQKRSAYTNLDNVYKELFKSGTWDISVLSSIPDGYTVGEKDVYYGSDGKNGDYDNPNVTEASFTLPFPVEDVVFNPNVGSGVAPVEVDVRATYKYEF